MNDVQATPHIDDKATCEALNEIVSAYLEDAARKAASEAGRRREGVWSTPNVICSLENAARNARLAMGLMDWSNPHLPSREGDDIPF
ncbi:MAG TPA: hypothetical protein DCL72_12600 [Rhizobiales bacterium]|jgi:hypothetical protein|nr:hypothetical protein [Hyphomicrobiales bacterium]HCL61007.1 hypothetical protein [Hyphomicrobiales bacterium]